MYSRSVPQVRRCGRQRHYILGNGPEVMDAGRGGDGGRLPKSSLATATPLSTDLRMLCAGIGVGI